MKPLTQILSKQQQQEHGMEYTVKELRHMIDLLDMLAARQAARHVVPEDAVIARRRNILLILEAAEVANTWRAKTTESGARR